MLILLFHERSMNLKQGYTRDGWFGTGCGESAGTLVELL